jgi:hypothetical protein
MRWQFMLAYRSLCPSGWTTRWDEQRGKWRDRNRVDSRAVADAVYRGWYLPSQTRPVDIPFERRTACSGDFVGWKTRGSESGIGGIEYMYHIDRQRQCSSDSHIILFMTSVMLQLSACHNKHACPSTSTKRPSVLDSLKGIHIPIQVLHHMQHSRHYLILLDGCNIPPYLAERQSPCFRVDLEVNGAYKTFRRPGITFQSSQSMKPGL